jgi:hypothetical protein
MLICFTILPTQLQGRPQKGWSRSPLFCVMAIILEPPVLQFINLWILTSVTKNIIDADTKISAKHRIIPGTTHYQLFAIFCPCPIVGPQHPAAQFGHTPANLRALSLPLIVYPLKASSGPINSCKRYHGCLLDSDPQTCEERQPSPVDKHTRLWCIGVFSRCNAVDQLSHQ